jgi:hypothetical protein
VRKKSPIAKPGSRKRKPQLPRAPLPRQTEQTHEDKTKRPFRKEKHKKRWEDL